ncbi:hypothetical protein DASC09_043120 [Saccharomycopsis crataegensis]|uniref:DDE Tnp4 domain-containing protein n=1 Tax=Saccharomycopsis crataegensis TaxID=43959 RepID=A0AAV5QQ51_9ASCO|nr:hypothetical protein DASC09_043120 [Saccharomycopsis crataegensis]
MLLTRLAIPNRFYDLSVKFGKSMSAISTDVKHLALYISDTLGYLLNVNSYKIDEERKRVLKKEGQDLQSYHYYSDLCFFLYGTVVQIRDPTKKKNAKPSNNGHKNNYCLNQVLLGTDNIIYGLEGPVAGSVHDLRHFKK